MFLGKAKIKIEKVTESVLAPFIIRRYLLTTPIGQRKLILGGHWSNHEGWLILNEGHQDITKRLKIPDKTFDVVFLEHVFEHIRFDGAIFFLKEAKRILSKGGIIRIVAPFLEKIIATTLNENDKNDKIYIQNNLINLGYPELDKLLKSIGLKGISQDAKTFLFNAIFREYEHKFIWSTKLLKSVMEALKFKKVTVFKPGFGHNRKYCIERRHRGVYLGINWEEDSKSKKIYDPESMAVEAIK